MTCKISVVIPYYQEEPGILRGAVLSAIAQEGISDLEIIIVDDGSPAPARHDLRGLELPSHVTLKLIEQENRGPGAARNQALDNLDKETAFVAFLDSDDRWAKSHLNNGMRALNGGYDFYFSDEWLPQYGESIFGRAECETSRYLYTDPNKTMRSFRGLSRFDLLSIIHISTFMYRSVEFQDLRFPESFSIGEDRAFFLRLMQHSDSIVFSETIDCISGEGVNIYKSVGWGSPNNIWLICEIFKSRIWIKKNIHLSLEELVAIDREISKLRESFVLTLIHEVRTMSAFKNAHILRFLLIDPSMWFRALPMAVTHVLERICKRG